MLRTDLTPEELAKALKDYKAQTGNCRMKPPTSFGEPVRMDMSFDEWLDVWLQSGKLRQRGKGAGKYCMGRINDDGHYAVDNVIIITGRQNTSMTNNHRLKKMVPSDVVELIRASAETNVALMAKYNVSWATVSRIRNGRGKYKIEKAALNTGSLVF